ncbi:hypothetical protein JZ751_010880 [Albula glossodonta]|uniref:GDNF/GAS1 domain-containing protein n=1 Tax=Albula glossodonta TaxID=121402 RepID=A0A8T2NYJ9_9TELE|nr:hypothetical protein JZ751_010880 [Albula glossodonta]
MKTALVTEGSCTITGSQECNMTIAYLLDQFPLWRGCLCTEEDYCSTPQLLAPNCPHHSDSQTSRRSWNEDKLDLSSASVSSESSGCLSNLQDCRVSSDCWSVYEKLRDSCSGKEESCDNPASRNSCLLLLGELKRTPLANCTCPMGGRKCLKLQTLLQNNPCIHAVQEASPLPLSLQDTRQRNHLRGSDMSTARDRVSSCFHTAANCVNDEVCNAQLVPLVQACTASRCNASACARATWQFYHSLPRTVAEMLVFCECDAADLNCLRFRADLQSGTCSGQLDQMPNCLELHGRCMKDELCRRRYWAFQSKCFREGEECHALAPSNCLCLLDPELILGGDAKCQWAFMGTMGTMLQQPCTCEGLQAAHLHKCKKLHEVLHNRSIFISHFNNEVFPHHKAYGNETGLTAQWFSDQLLFSLICILVIVIILMIIIMVLRTLGMCRVAEKAKFHPPPVKKNCPMSY